MKKKMKWLGLLAICITLDLFSALYNADPLSPVGEEASALSGDDSPELAGASLSERAVKEFPELAKRIAEPWHGWRGTAHAQPKPRRVGHRFRGKLDKLFRSDRSHKRPATLKKTRQAQQKYSTCHAKTSPTTIRRRSMLRGSPKPWCNGQRRSWENSSLYRP